MFVIATDDSCVFSVLAVFDIRWVRNKERNDVYWLFGRYFVRALKVLTFGLAWVLFNTVYDIKELDSILSSFIDDILFNFRLSSFGILVCFS